MRPAVLCSRAVRLGARPKRPGYINKLISCYRLVDTVGTVDRFRHLPLEWRVPTPKTAKLKLSAESLAATGGGQSPNFPGEYVVKLTLRDKESAQEAVRRFRKLVERSGIKKEMRVREFYEKPSEIKRRARLRAERRSRREKFFATH
jgi:small subunit ribosomal protein S21